MRVKFSLALLVVLATLSLPFLTKSSDGQPFMHLSMFNPMEPESYRT